MTKTDLIQNHKITLKSFFDFGLFVFKSESLNLFVRCGNGLHEVSGVHAHQDQLSIDLTIAGKAICLDPGSFVYSSSKSLRNIYRSAASHCAPTTITKEKKNILLNSSAFSTIPHCQGFVLHITNDCFVGATTVEGGVVVRNIYIHDKYIEINDNYYLENDNYLPYNLQFEPFFKIHHSPEYGKQIK